VTPWGEPIRSIFTGSLRGEASVGVFEEAGEVGVSLVSRTKSSDIWVPWLLTEEVDLFADKLELTEM
jgi:hypothetical protein